MTEYLFDHDRLDLADRKRSRDRFFCLSMQVADAPGQCVIVAWSIHSFAYASGSD
jgi:hypothetical protein